MLPVRFHKGSADQEVIQVFFRRRFKNRGVFDEKIILFTFVKKLVIMPNGIAKLGFTILINRPFPSGCSRIRQCGLMLSDTGSL